MSQGLPAPALDVLEQGPSPGRHQGHLVGQRCQIICIMLHLVLLQHACDTTIVAEEPHREPSLENFKAIITTKTFSLTSQQHRR